MVLFLLKGIELNKFYRRVIVYRLAGHITNFIRPAVLIVMPVAFSSAIAADSSIGDEGMMSSWQFSGLMEMQVNAGHDFSGKILSDITVATIELAAQTRINPWVSASIALLYEEDNTEPHEVDAAILTLGNKEDQPYTVTVGRTYVPFGVYDSNMISDPLTLELGETRETLVALNYEQSGFLASVYVFNGDIDRQASNADSIRQFGMSFSYLLEDANKLVDMEFSYMSNLADSDSIRTIIMPPSVQDSVPGMSATLTYNYEAWVLVTEYVAALKRFSSGELVYAGDAAKPSAYTIELAHIVNWSGKEYTLAVAQQGTREALALGLPEKRVLLSIGTLIYENLNLRAEWRRDTDYGVSVSGTGNRANMVTLQAAVNF